MQQNQLFLLLAIGHKNVRLYQGDRTSIHLVDIKDFPADMKQTLGIDEYSNERSVHTVIKAGTVKGVSASQYDTANTDKVMLKEFFRRVDNMLHKFLIQHNYPLILAGVDYVQAIYRSVNSYPHLIQQGIPGNQDEAKEKDLHQYALTILHPKAHGS